MVSKIGNLQTAVESIDDGSIIALGGNTLNRGPMGFCRELARQRKRGLRLVKTAGGMDVDILCLAGCVSSVDAGFISFETKYGLADNYRRAVQSGAVKANEHACYTVVSALRAAAAGLPFMPVRGLINSDLINANDYFKTVNCPFTGEQLTAVKAIVPDIAVIHVHEADKSGNAVIKGPKFDDVLMSRAAKRVIITAEKILPQSYFQNKTTAVDIPHFLVSDVIHLPGGAYPNACAPNYEVSEAGISEYGQIYGNNTDGNRSDGNNTAGGNHDCGKALDSYLKKLEKRDYHGVRKL